MKRNFGERILGRGGVVLGVFLLSALGALAMLDTRKVTVESKDGERATRYILIGRQGTVYLVEQLSATRCVKGKNWNHDDLKIWVDDGCRAVLRFTETGLTNPAIRRGSSSKASMENGSPVESTPVAAFG